MENQKRNNDDNSEENSFDEQNDQHLLLKKYKSTETCIIKRNPNKTDRTKNNLDELFIYLFCQNLLSWPMESRERRWKRR